MKDFLEKWKSDKRYRAKIKLLAYTIFIIIIFIYALTLDISPRNYEDISDINNNSINKTADIIKIPEQYEYIIKIKIDDKEYKYSGIQTTEKRTIKKEIDDKVTNYIYQNNQYYLEDSININNYVTTTKEEVYDIVNYNYINLTTINEYLKKATKDNNQYLVYLKDIILGNESDRYFVIDINDKNIFVDYTVLMKEFNNNIKTYTVNYEIKEKE